MTDDDFQVTVTAGSLRPEGGSITSMPHTWTEGGVSIEAAFTGAHLLHLAAAGCVLNDLYREAQRMGIDLDGVRVRARGGFDVETWSSTGITYDVDLESDAAPEDLERLLALVDDVAEIPRALRRGTTVRRRH
jgi:uncharacterized OsmC-like protein